MDDLISIIVPIYKVELYLNRCVESIVSQTYRYLEIILVDDGSPDRCPDICDEWKRKDNRICVIHKVNEGLSVARNVGMAFATGEYIAFVDSDDWIHSEYIESLYTAIKKYKVDLAACDICVTSTKVQETPIVPIFREYLKEEALQTLINGEVFRAVVWNKLYHKNVLKGEVFELGRYHEDEFFTYKILEKIDRMVFVNNKLYYYFQREGSIMNSISYKHLDALDAYVERINSLKKYPELYKIDKIKFCIACIQFYQETLKIKTKEKIIYQKRIKNRRQIITFKFNELIHSSLKELLYICGSRICIDLFSKVILLKRKRVE